MEAFTLRLEPALAKQLDQICRSEGYTKTGLVKSLIRDFLNKRSASPRSPAGSPSRLRKLVRVVTVGGDAVKDSEGYFE